MNEARRLWKEYGELHRKFPDPGSQEKVAFVRANSEYLRPMTASTRARAAVVIIAHNEQAYLPRALASVNQAMGIVEAVERPRVVVVDNASSDATGEIAREFGVCLVAEPRKGIGRARQTGLEATLPTEEIVLTTDADVAVDVNWIKVLTGALFCPSVVGGYGPIRVEFDAPMSLSQRFQIGIIKTGGVVVKAVRRAGSTPLCPGSANLAFKRSAAFEVGGYDMELIGGEDVNLVRRLGMAGDVKCVFEAVVIHSRRREQGEGLLVNAFRVGVDEILRAMGRPGSSDLRRVYSKDHRQW